MWRGRRFADLTARAKAWIEPIHGAQTLKGIRMQIQPLGLPRRLAIPIDPQRSEVTNLTRQVLLAHTLAVEVLDSQ